LKSTLHRVVQPPVDDGDVFTKERFSIPFFMQADRKKLIQCAPELVGPEGPKYPPVTAMDYLYKRTAASFYS
jgi:isopenicillin N synthase-like dioxygenase